MGQTALGCVHTYILEPLFWILYILSRMNYVYGISSSLYLYVRVVELASLRSKICTGQLMKQFSHQCDTKRCLCRALYSISCRLLRSWSTRQRSQTAPLHHLWIHRTILLSPRSPLTRPVPAILPTQRSLVGHSSPVCAFRLRRSGGASRWSCGL